MEAAYQLTALNDASAILGTQENIAIPGWGRAILIPVETRIAENVYQKATISSVNAGLGIRVCIYGTLIIIIIRTIFSCKISYKYFFLIQK